MTETEVVDKLKTHIPNGVHHNLQGCIRWAATLLGRRDYRRVVFQIKDGGFTNRIPDFVGRSVYKGLPRLDLYEIENTSYMSDKKETEYYWLADALWEHSIYMTLSRVSGNGCMIRECFTSMREWGGIVQNAWFVEDASSVSWKIPESLRDMKRQRIKRYYVNGAQE
jgi:hypothetical protein